MIGDRRSLFTKEGKNEYLVLMTKSLIEFVVVVDDFRENNLQDVLGIPIMYVTKQTKYFSYNIDCLVKNKINPFPYSIYIISFKYTEIRRYTALIKTSINTYHMQTHIVV